MISEHTPEAVNILPIAVDAYVPEDTTRRLLGAYYTPRSAADYMADWVVRHNGEHILEPSFGDGIFLRAISASAARRNFEAISLSGIEINGKVIAQALAGHVISHTNVRCEDFLAVAPFKVQAVIGNPPFVRLRHLPAEQQRRALKVAEEEMGQAMDPGGSVWMPFVLHAMRFLENGGRLCFVLPYDFTYVRYARPLWETLCCNFESLQVLRTRERLFPELLQDVVILMADGYGSHTDRVRYQAFEQVMDLVNSRPVVDEIINVRDLLQGKRAFISALLEDELRHLLDTRVDAATVPARTLITFNIGYVAGDKEFFHPTEEDIYRYQIPFSSLHPTLTSARMLKGIGLRTSSLATSQLSRLFLPNPEALTAGEQLYIDMGKKRGVSERYKCRIRDPWFVVPGTRVPDVVLSVFSERPVLLINDDECFASNSLLCGYTHSISNNEIAARWYTSLTLLQCELEVHALGGGVMVMVPREAGNIRLPKQIRVDGEHLRQVDQLLRIGRTTAAYQSGDRAVLIEQLGFTEHEVDLVRHGVEVLAHWRTSARSSQAYGKEGFRGEAYAQ